MYSDPGFYADKASIVDRIEHLSRPPMGDILQHRHFAARPLLEALETRVGVIGFAALVVLAANQHDIQALIPGLKAHVVIGFFRVPVERIRQGAATDGEAHDISSVGRGFRMHRHAVDDR